VKRRRRLKVAASHQTVAYGLAKATGGEKLLAAEPAESSDARKTAMEAMSPGWPMRPSGVCAMMDFSKSDPMTPPLWVPSVSTTPGLMV
jgi:hypothetical protein